MIKFLLKTIHNTPIMFSSHFMCQLIINNIINIFYASACPKVKRGDKSSCCVLFLLNSKNVKNFCWSIVDLQCQFLLYSKVNQLYIYLSLLFFRFFSHIGHYRVLRRVPYAIQQVLISYLFYIQQCAYVNPNLTILINTQNQYLTKISSFLRISSKSLLFILENIFESLLLCQ